MQKYLRHAVTKHDNEGHISNIKKYLRHAVTKHVNSFSVIALLTKAHRQKLYYPPQSQTCSNKCIIDSAYYAGVLLEKNSEEALELFETLSEYSQQFSSKGRQEVKSNGMYKVNMNSGVKSQMAAMERKLDMLVKASTQRTSPIQRTVQISVGGIDQEQANYVGQNNYPPKNNPYSNT